MSTTSLTQQLLSNALPSPSNSIAHTDAYDESQQIYEQIFGIDSISKFSVEYITSGQLLNDLHLRIFPHQSAMNNENTDPNPDNTKSNKQKLHEIIDITHHNHSSEDVWNTLLPEYHNNSLSSYCNISNTIEWNHVLSVFHIIKHFASNETQNETSSATLTPQKQMIDDTSNHSDESNQNITINDTFVEKTTTTTSYTPPVPKCNNLLQKPFLSQQQHRSIRRIQFSHNFIHNKSPQDDDDIDHDGDAKAFSPNIDTNDTKDVEANDDAPKVKKCYSPPSNQILLSAKKAMSAIRGRNIDNAVLLSGRKLVCNVMPRSRKTKKCTPGLDRRIQRNEANNMNNTNNTNNTNSNSVVQSNKKNKCKLTKKLSFVNEDQHAEHKDDDTSSISSISSHYGWKSREQSQDATVPTKKLNISMLSHVLVDLESKNMNESNEDDYDDTMMDELKETIEELQTEICNKNMSIQEYDIKLTEKTGECRRLQHEWTNYKEEYQDSMEHQLAQLTQDNDALKQELNTKTTEYESKCSSFVDVLNKKEHEIREKESTNLSRENELKTIYTKLEIFKKRQSKMGQIELCKSKLLGINADYQSLKSAVKFQLERTSQELKQIQEGITQGLKDRNYNIMPQIYDYNANENTENDVDNLKSERDELSKNLFQLNISYQTEKKLRKQLLEQIIDLKGNIRVFCRVRPKMKRKATENECELESELMATTCLDEERLVISDDNNKKEFSFDHVYKPSTSQETVFDDVRPLIHSCVDGYNVCIFAYGQTGSGKTYTMEGEDSNRGVIYRSFDELFALKRRDNGLHIYLSCLEIYNEKIRDLLGVNAGNDVTLKAKLSKCGKKVLVPGLTKIQVTTTDHVRDLLMYTAYKNRATGITNMNEHSSRSHALLFVDIVRDTTSSRLVLIDLAGSERVKKTGVSGAAFDEARAINKSLSALGNVINSLQTKAKHIPFRDSQLTYLLVDCLGGNSRALMFCNISCESFDVKESVNTLLFANRVRRVQLGEAHKNESNSNNSNNNNSNSNGREHTIELKQKVKKYKKETEDKDREINHLKMNNRNLNKEITKLTSSIGAQNNKNSNHHQTRVEFNSLQKEHSRIILDLEKKEKAIKKLNNDITDYKHKLCKLKPKNQYNHNHNIRPRTATLSTLNRVKNPRKRKLPKDNEDSTSTTMDNTDLKQPLQKRRKMNNYGMKVQNRNLHKSNNNNRDRNKTNIHKTKQVPSYQAPTRNSRVKAKNHKVMSVSSRSRSSSLDGKKLAIHKVNTHHDNNNNHPNTRQNRINSLDSVHSVSAPHILSDVQNTKSKLVMHTHVPFTPTSAIEALKNGVIHTNLSDNKNKNDGNSNKNKKKDHKLEHGKRKTNHVPITVSSLQIKSSKNSIWK